MNSDGGDPFAWGVDGDGPPGVSVFCEHDDEGAPYLVVHVTRGENDVIVLAATGPAASLFIRQAREAFDIYEQGPKQGGG